MKCLINCPIAMAAWSTEFFDGCPPYLLEIANKPYLEYLIDYCVLSGIREIKIITDAPEQNLEDALGYGDRWGISISYGAAREGMPLSEVISHNFKALGGDDLLVMNGMFFLNYDQRAFRPVTVGPDEVLGCSPYLYWIGKKRNDGRFDPDSARRPDPEGLVDPLGSIGDFYRKSMALVHGEAERYSMNSYNNSPRVYIGQNVAISRTAEICEPVHLGSVIQIGDNTRIGPGVVIGENSFIDDDTVIENSVIMGNSYIGCNLEIIGKIVYRNIIINPENGLKLDIVDDFLLAQVKVEEHSGVGFCQRAAAAFLWVISLVPFMVLRPFLKIRSEDVDCFLNCTAERRIQLRLYLRPSNSFAAHWFRKLSLDRFHLLGLVIKGEVKLVGNLLLRVTEENRRRLEQFPNYAPGLFSYSEMLQHTNDPYQSEMDELYYVYHASFRFNWAIIRNTLVRNLLKAT